MEPHQSVDLRGRIPARTGAFDPRKVLCKALGLSISPPRDDASPDPEASDLEEEGRSPRSSSEDGLLRSPRGPAPGRPLLQLVLLNGWQLAVSATWFVLLIVAIPAQVAAVVGPERQGSAIGAVLGSAVPINLLASPIVGGLSDRWSSSMGRRRPFIALGAAGMAIAVQWLLRSSSLMECVLAYNLTCCGAIVASVSFNGLLMDCCPVESRGSGSGAMGAMTHIGSLLGAGIGACQLGTGAVGALLALLLIGGAASTVFTAWADKPLVDSKDNGKDNGTEGCSEMIRPLRENNDFRWCFITRLLMQQGVYTVQEFLQFFLKDAVALPEGMSPGTAVSAAMALLMVAATASGAVAGIATDRMGGRRKVFVRAASAVMAVSCVAMLLSDRFGWILCMSIGFGVGYGIFLSIDFALVMDVLPDPEHAARDLAVWHAALVLPQVLATPVGGVLLDAGNKYGETLGYRLVFVLASVYFALAAVLIDRIRKVQ